MTANLLDLHGTERRITIAETPYPGHRVAARRLPITLPTLDPVTPTVLVTLDRTVDQYEFRGTVRDGLAVYACASCTRCEPRG